MMTTTTKTNYDNDHISSVLAHPTAEEIGGSSKINLYSSITMYNNLSISITICRQLFRCECEGATYEQSEHAELPPQATVHL